METAKLVISSASSSGSFVKSSIGQKVFQAVTGAVFLLYVTGHMLGNLQVFIGQDQINGYAEKLQSLGALLWGIRLFIICFFGVHIFIGLKLYIENLLARPISYRKSVSVEADVSSKTMIFSGGAMLLYVLYHLLHLTAHTTNPEYATFIDAHGRPDVYSMIITGFRVPLISAVYLLATIFLAFHVNHGFFSFLQTLGLTRLSNEKCIKKLGNLFAIVVFIGYASIPLAAFFNVIKLPGE